MAAQRIPVEIRFWAKVDKAAPNGCWNWTAYVSANGYGYITLTGRKRARAHRVAWEMANGSVPDGMVVCHACDNRRCCNPAHLWLGTQSDNIRDAVAKGRFSRDFRNLTRKSHCKRGHKFTPQNTYIWRGHRRCRACNLIQWRKSRARKGAPETIVASREKSA